MTLLGKILTVLIFFMSVAFMALALSVYMDHTVWREVVERPASEAGPGKPVGLKIQLAEAQKKIQEAQQQVDELRRQLELEQASRAQAIAALESSLQELLVQVQAKEAEIAELQTQLRGKLDQFVTQQENLAMLNDEVEGLRERVRQTLEERNKSFQEVVAVTNELQQARSLERILSERNQQLVDQIEYMRLILESLGTDEHQPLPNIPPPGIEGSVVAVNQQNDRVEISIGGDDGIRLSHELEVFRGTTYVGRLRIVQVAPDRAIGEFLPQWRQAPIQRGDTVAPKAS